jgi:beta-glucosidase
MVHEIPSNYLDVSNEPLFPFGFGLSHTTFDYKNLKLSDSSLTAAGQLKVSVDVTNTGNYDGAEVVQLYIRDLVGSVTRPVKELKGFQKLFLKKGETRTVEFTLTEKDLRFYNSDLNLVSEPGDFKVFVGGSSDRTLDAGFMLK